MEEQDKQKSTLQERMQDGFEEPINTGVTFDEAWERGVEVELIDGKFVEKKKSE